ncbi:hypothetical protein BYT27DRAFT_7247682 [Phlegmacium glaucopus]|nr:hypothetical protein BYT27DRAFT_7247682 [Phlegmacium glaucopus]
MPHVPDASSDDGNSSGLDTEYHSSNSRLESSSESESSESEVNDEASHPAEEIIHAHRISRSDQELDNEEENTTPSSKAFHHPHHITPEGAQTPLAGSSQIDKDDEIRTLQRQLENTCAQRDAAEVHAVMAQREAAVWKSRFNQKKDKAAEPSCRRLHTSSRVVTNDQGLAEACED